MQHRISLPSQQRVHTHARLRAHLRKASTQHLVRQEHLTLPGRQFFQRIVKRLQQNAARKLCIRPCVRRRQQVLERRKEISRIELQHEEFTVAQMMAQLRTQILASDDYSLSLAQFFEACPSRHAMIVAFLAVLEMVKLQAVGLAQDQQFGDIVVRKGKAFETIFDENGAIRQIDQEYQ